MPLCLLAMTDLAADFISICPSTRQPTTEPSDKTRNFARVRTQTHFTQTDGIFTVLTFYQPRTTPSSSIHSTPPSTPLACGGGRVLCHCMYAFIIHNTVQHLITMSQGRKLRIMTCYKLVRNLLLKGDR